MAGYIGSKAVSLSTTGADIAGDADVSGALDVGGGLTVDNDGSTVLTVDRATSNGTIIDLQKSGSSVGVVGVNGDRIYLTNAQEGIMIDQSANNLSPTSSTGTFNDNAMNLGESGNRWKDLYLSGGVVFGATGGSVTSKTLDDYEEGTFTVGFTGATVSSAYSTAYYTKIGRLVYWTHYTGSTTISSVTGDLVLTGLPFTVKNAANGYSVLHTAHQTFFNNVNVVTGYHEVNVTTARFIISNSTTSATPVAGLGKYMMVSGVYMTDS